MILGLGFGIPHISLFEVTVKAQSHVVNYYHSVICKATRDLQLRVILLFTFTIPNQS